VNTTFKQTLKARAHHLKPVVLLGVKGLTEAVIEETEVAVKFHELIKVKLSGVEKDQRHQTALDLCARLHAELIQLIGNTAVIYRKSDT
jgi:RNA-binding protein